jgi:kynurenine formamidase
MKRSALLVCCLGIAGCSGSPGGEPAPGGRAGGVWIDLTHPFDEAAVYWPTADTFELDEVFRGMTDGGFFYSANNFAAAEHGGTHVDAPIHFAEGKWNVDDIPLERLMGPAVVIDVSQAALADPDYLVGVADFEAWEAAHGRMPDGAIVLLNTGFTRYWPDRSKYMGTERRGEEAVPELHFPGLDPDAARWLVTERTVHAVGLDTPSIDYGQSTSFDSHRILFARNVPAFENVASLDKLPASGAWVMALPMKIRGGTGGPLRIVAHLPG